MTSQVTRYASALDIELSSAEINLRFDFTRDLSAANYLEYWARFGTNEPDERIHEVMTRVEKGCHTTNTIRAAVPVIPHFRLNGEELPYTPTGMPPIHSETPPDRPEAFTIDASIRIIETYWREGSSEGFTVNADEALVRGGTGKALGPLGHFLVGTGFGIGTQAVMSAKAIGFHLDHFEIDVETAYDLRGKHMLGDLYVGQIWFQYWLNIHSPEPPSRALQLIDHLERHCRTTNTLRHPVRLIPHVIVNEREIEFSLPEQPAPEVVRAERGTPI